jgi:hypothetical protein
MPRASTKPELILSANEQFDKMWKLIDSLTDEEQNQTFRFGDDAKRKEAHWSRDKNLRDVLIHLHEWHRLLLDWIKANKSGKAKPFLPDPYNWKTYGKMNEEFWKKHQSTPYPKSKAILKKSHSEVMTLIETFFNDELFVKGSLPWTGGSTLGSYCISATASHYDWAIKKIKLHIKTIK